MKKVPAGVLALFLAIPLWVENWARTPTPVERGVPAVAPRPLDPEARPPDPAGLRSFDPEDRDRCHALQRELAAARRARNEKAAHKSSPVWELSPEFYVVLVREGHLDRVPVDPGTGAENFIRIEDGRLICATHGSGAVTWAPEQRLRCLEKQAEIARAVSEYNHAHGSQRTDLGWRFYHELERGRFLRAAPLCPGSGLSERNFRIQDGFMHCQVHGMGPPVESSLPSL